MTPDHIEDAVVIGGGLYGTVIANYIAQKLNFKKITLIEHEAALLSKASFNNQARVHNGYHYPRSYTTAYRSRVNLPKFVHDWPSAVSKNFVKLYAIARRNSKVTAGQFVRFCNEIDAKIESASPAHKKLFNPRLIEEVFEVEEYAFNADILAKLALKELLQNQIKIRLNTRASAIFKEADNNLKVVLKNKDNTEYSLRTRYVFNCTYSGINQLGGDFLGVQTRLKHEITEMALLEPPISVENLAITVMDGPFFSFMPFPAKNMYTLSHVRYTPHTSWLDDSNNSPYSRLKNYRGGSRANRMIRDACRYMPCLDTAAYVDSIFEVKTILVRNETDDGRPILFEAHSNIPGCYSVLGGKIDNIYDVLERIDACIKPIKQR